MSDERTPDEESEFGGMAIPLPGFGAFLSRARDHHDRQHMEVEDLQTRIYHFLDGLSADQLMVLRKMFAATPDSQMNNYFEGMIVTLMRRVHGVDPDTGLTPEQALSEAAEREKKKQADGE